MFDDDINAQRRELIRLNMLSVGSVVGWYIDTYLDKKSYRDSTLSSNAYANKLLSGHLECRAFSTSSSHGKAYFYEVV